MEYLRMTSYSFKMKLCLTFFIVPLALIQTDTFANDKIPCPSTHIIQAAAEKLDTAQKIQDEFITYTSASVYQSNDLWWFVGVGNINADSSTQALAIGKQTLINISDQQDAYATKHNDEYICNYGPGYVQARGKTLG